MSRNTAIGDKSKRSPKSISFTLSHNRSWLGYYCIQFSFQLIFLDRHDVWQSCDPTSIQNFEFCEKAVIPPFFILHPFVVSACWYSSAKFVEIVRCFNSKMIQLRQKSWQIVTFSVFAMRNVHSVTQHIVLISVDTEKLRNVNITTKIHSTILIGYQWQSVLPEHLSNHRIWLRHSASALLYQPSIDLAPPCQ